MDEIAEIDQAHREINLAQQHIFRESIMKHKSRHRKVLLWGGLAALGFFVFWVLYHCRILHHIFYS